MIGGCEAVGNHIAATVGKMLLTLVHRLHGGDKRMTNAIPHHSVPYQPILAFIKNLFRCFDVISLHIVPSYSMRLL